MKKNSQQWINQAEYDLNTAEYMFDGGRFFYSVFMCHLSIEKARKGLYFEKTEEIPPKVHNLIYFLNQLKIQPPVEIGKFIIKLNEASVATQYPEDLDKIIRNYTKAITQNIIENTKEALTWIKAQY